MKTPKNGTFCPLVPFILCVFLLWILEKININTYRFTPYRFIHTFYGGLYGKWCFKKGRGDKNGKFEILKNYASNQ